MIDWFSKEDFGSFPFVFLNTTILLDDAFLVRKVLDLSGFKNGNLFSKRLSLLLKHVLMDGWFWHIFMFETYWQYIKKVEAFAILMLFYGELKFLHLEVYPSKLICLTFGNILINFQGLALWGFLLLHESIHLPEYGKDICYLKRKRQIKIKFLLNSLYLLCQQNRTKNGR